VEKPVNWKLLGVEATVSALLTMKKIHKFRPIFDPPIVRQALRDALTKLDPRRQLRNPVMLVVWVGALMTTFYLAHDLRAGQAYAFDLQVALWLWLTALVAAPARALLRMHGQEKAPADRVLNILLASLTVAYLIVVLSLHPTTAYGATAAARPSPITVAILIAVFVCLIPPLVGGLLDAADSRGAAQRSRPTAGDADVLPPGETDAVAPGKLTPAADPHRRVLYRCAGHGTIRPVQARAVQPPCCLGLRHRGQG
jgi:high-affinity K+ transport system ATPase subunit B